MEAEGTTGVSRHPNLVRQLERERASTLTTSQRNKCQSSESMVRPRARIVTAGLREPCMTSSPWRSDATMPDERHPLKGSQQTTIGYYIALRLADTAHSLVLARQMHCHGRGAEGYVSKHGLFWEHQRYRTKETENEACIMIKRMSQHVACIFGPVGRQRQRIHQGTYIHRGRICE